MEFYCVRTVSKKLSFPFVWSLHMLFFSTGLFDPGRKSWQYTVFKGEVYSFQITIIIIIKVVSAFFIYGNDLEKWDGSLQDLNLAHCLSNSEQSCFSILSPDRLEEHHLFSPLYKALQKEINIRNTEKQTKQQPLCHLHHQVYSATGHSSQTSWYTLGCSGQGIC